jgi:hypothetical protein
LETDDNRGNEEITMITKLVTNDNNNSFKLPLCYIFLEDTKYMTILTRQEKERLVRELYNQGKTYRQISKEARISPRDIGVILNKEVEKKKTEGLKEDNNGADKNQGQEEEQQQHLSLSTQAYKLFSEGKTPLEVAIALNLRESEATKFCREYWKLKQLYHLNMIYEEIKDDISSLLKLYNLSKAKGLGIQQIVDVLAVANNDLPAIEERFKRLRNDISILQSQKHTCKRDLYQLNNQIATTSRLLNSLCISCERERREIENLSNEKARLECFVSQFKSNNEEYLKIKQVAEEKVKDILTNGKLLLRFATASVIKSLGRNPELTNFVFNDISNNNDTSDGSNCLSLMLPGQQQQSFSYLNDDIFTAVILEEAENLYNQLTTKLTNEVMAAAGSIRESLPPSLDK